MSFGLALYLASASSVLSRGRHVQWLYYGSGHLHQIRVDGHVLSDIGRDALHQEIERTQGALESRYGWDHPMGRLVAHKVGRRQALQGQPGMPSPQALRDRDQGLPALPQLPSGDRIARQYRCDPTGPLIATRDGLRGVCVFAWIFLEFENCILIVR
ncbi:hypothetical protein L0947_08405 [Paracidovorax citrulli]